MKRDPLHENCEKLRDPLNYVMYRFPKNEYNYTCTIKRGGTKKCEENGEQKGDLGIMSPYKAEWTRRQGERRDGTVQHKTQRSGQNHYTRDLHTKLNNKVDPEFSRGGGGELCGHNEAR